MRCITRGGDGDRHRLPQPMEADAGPVPPHSGVLGAPAVVQLANLPAHRVESSGPLRAGGCAGKGWRWRHHGARLEWQMTIGPASLQRGLTNSRDLHPTSAALQRLLCLPEIHCWKNVQPTAARINTGAVRRAGGSPMLGDKHRCSLAELSADKEAQAAQSTIV